MTIGTAGEGILHVGDRVVAIDHLDAAKLTHADAQNIFKHAGTSIALDIVRFVHPTIVIPGQIPFTL